MQFNSIAKMQKMAPKVFLSSSFYVKQDKYLLKFVADLQTCYCIYTKYSDTLNTWTLLILGQC